MKRQLLDNLKNIPGWHTAEKLVAFSVDDYGNVRVDSKAARDRMTAAGLDLRGRFDRFDTLEARQDLEALFEVLASVVDAGDRSAVFTPYALCANPDFDAMRSGDPGYRYEPLPRTFERLTVMQPQAYDGAWALWREGMRLGLLKPQLHGREHLNVEVLERKLKAVGQDPEVVQRWLTAEWPKVRVQARVGHALVYCLSLLVKTMDFSPKLLVYG